jgi:hypothetical protein
MHHGCAVITYLFASVLAFVGSILGDPALILVRVVDAPRRSTIVSNRLRGDNSGLVCDTAEHGPTVWELAKEIEPDKQWYVLDNGSPGVVGLNDLDTLWTVDTFKSLLQVAA